MIGKVKERFQEDKRNQKIVETVFDNPYLELKDALKDIEENDKQEYETLLEQLIKDFILIELTSQAGSNIESRVPKRLLIVNPEIEEELEKLL